MLEQQVPQHDQLGFFVFLAFALHLMLVLGVSFSLDAGRASQPQLEVTLAQFQSQQAPEDARFVAQANQEGSGTLAERAELTTRRQAEFSDNQIRELGGAPVVTQQPQQRRDRIATTIADAVNEVLVDTREEEPEPLVAAAIDPEIRKLNQSIASLEARLDQQQQAYAERPRVKRLTSLSARAAEDAAYLHNWRSKVEAVGNRYYPTASSRYGIYGDLRLLVAIRYDGEIDTIEVLSSSGHAVLDEAAIRIVRLAAPFEPFPANLRETTDRLEIIRTWKFRKNRLSSERG
ncbi:MAG: TonB family protein [Pseudomonadota bacterium]